jgi:preprotein translocase subunit SecG
MPARELRNRTIPGTRDSVRTEKARGVFREAERDPQNLAACYTIGSVMVYLLTGVHVLVCFFLIIVVLLQSGKAADLAGAFGGMGSQTVFGPRGTATVLSKATTIAAALFMVTSLSLVIVTHHNAGGTGSVIKTHPAAVQKAKPAPTSTKK